MAQKTNIEWADHTFSPWWGCEKVSPGCKGCYAKAFSERVGHGKRLPTIWGVGAPRRFFGAKHWAQPLKWNRDAEIAGRRARVFCASMSDVFEDRSDLIDARARLFRLIESTPRLDWLLLTKRPENVQRLAAEVSWFETWPENVWLGTTAEDQPHADVRIPILLATNGPNVRFISYEPALGPIDFRPWLRVSSESPTISWVIIGGETGGNRRALELSWVRSTVAACTDAGVPVFVKQDSGPRPGLQGAIDDRYWAFKQFPEAA